MWDLDTYVEHPNVMEGEFAVVATEDVELALDYVGCVSASRAWFVLARLNLLPVICVNIENMDVVHPVHPVIPSEVVYFGVHEASSGAYSGAGFGACDDWLHPCEGRCVKVKYVVQLSVLVWLASE